MVIDKIKRYLKIYLVIFKSSFMYYAEYHTGLIIGIVVELGYQLANILFFNILFSNIKSLAGWSYGEMLFLVGLSMVAGELALGTVILSARWLPEKIKNGDLDFALLKPIDTLFYIGFSEPYFLGILSSLTGFFLMFKASGMMKVAFSIINLISAVIIFLCGYVISYSIIIISSSLSFKFANATALPRIGERIIVSFRKFPFQMYDGFLRVLFFFIIPVIFIAAVPTDTIIHGLSWSKLVLSLLFAAILLLLARLTWNTMIKNYTSASS